MFYFFYKHKEEQESSQVKSWEDEDYILKINQMAQREVIKIKTSSGFVCGSRYVETQHHLLPNGITSRHGDITTRKQRKKRMQHFLVEVLRQRYRLLRLNQVLIHPQRRDRQSPSRLHESL